MSDGLARSRLAALLGTLKPKTKQPVSTKVLNTWIAQAKGQLGTRPRQVDSDGWLHPLWQSLPHNAPSMQMDASSSSSREERFSNIGSPRQPGPPRMWTVLFAATWTPSHRVEDSARRAVGSADATPGCGGSDRCAESASRASLPLQSMTARDVVDLLLLQQLIAATGSPTLAEVRTASVAVFEARAKEARALCRPSRP